MGNAGLKGSGGGLMDGDLMASIGLLLAIAGGMVVRDRFVTKSIRDGDDQLHKRINEVKDVYVRRDDRNQHITPA